MEKVKPAGARDEILSRKIPDCGGVCRHPTSRFTDILGESYNDAKKYGKAEK